MPDDADFDPQALADVAEGRDVGSGGGDPAPDPDADAGASAGESDAGGESEVDDGEGGSSDGVLATFILPLFLADERGPSDSTFAERGVGRGLANVLDGATDYLLSLAGKDPGDSLGPAGKIGLGLSQMDVLDGGPAPSSTSDDDGGGEDGETAGIDGIGEGV